MKKFLLLLILILAVCFANTVFPTVAKEMQPLVFCPYGINKNELTDDQCDNVQLSKKADFSVGVAIDFQKLLNNENYRNLIISQFNSVTPEKSMKTSFIHPGKESYNFSEVDYLMDFCKKYNKRLHGHTLVWFKENPQWMEKFKGDKSAWELILKDHIQTVINHCRAQVKSWDVVNEAFNNDGSLKENIWLKNVGEDYIEKSFIYAAEADPTALLFYNDFDLESRSEKLNAVLKFLGKLKAKGIKIDGIGMQMHINIDGPYLSDINMAAMKVADQGFLVHYSEFDISLVKTGKLFTVTRHLLKRQGERVEEIVKGFRNLKSTYRFGITMWGLSDQDSWLTEKHGNDRPVLFDSRYKVKPAYCGFLKGLSE